MPEVVCVPLIPKKSSHYPIIDGVTVNLNLEEGINRILGTVHFMDDKDTEDQTKHQKIQSRNRSIKIEEIEASIFVGMTYINGSDKIISKDEDKTKWNRRKD